MKAINEIVGFMIIIPSVVIVGLFYLGAMLSEANPEMAKKVGDKAKEKALDYAKRKLG